MKRREPDCDKCYGERTEDCPPNCLTAHIRYVKDLEDESLMKIGKYCVIEDGVIIGKGTIIKNYVELREGTVIGRDSYIDSRVSTSGDCFIRDRVIIRYSGIIARGTIIENDVFIAPQFMTENISHRGEEVGGAQIGVGEWDRKTKYRVFIGTNVTLAAGIMICPGVVIGSKSNVRKSITEPGVYFGNPARKRGG